MTRSGETGLRDGYTDLPPPASMPVLMRNQRVFWLLATIAIIAAGMFNATIVYDDPYMILVFGELSNTMHFAKAAYHLFFGLDLGGMQYRLYGLSRVLHYAVWHLLGTHAWAYGAIIAAAYAATAPVIVRLLARFGATPLQYSTVAAVWLASPFATNTVFHHYSYLVLPYQVTFLCALVLQQTHDGPNILKYRLVSALLAIAVAFTGEAHLPAAMVVLLFTAFATPSDRSRKARAIDFCIPAAVIIIAVVLHRAAWSHIFADYTGWTRFRPIVPRLSMVPSITSGFVFSIALGAWAQVKALFEFAGLWSLGTFIPSFAIGYWVVAGAKNRPPAPNGLMIGRGLLLLFATSWVVFWFLALQLEGFRPIMWRHHGYVPYTIALMAIAAFVTAGHWRRVFGDRAAVVICTLTCWFWMTLNAICLPVVRAEDSAVWAQIGDALRREPEAGLVFLHGWQPLDQPGGSGSFHHNGLRGANFPEIFQSPFRGYWWQWAYARAVLGANAITTRAEPQADGRIRLFADTTAWVMAGWQNPPVLKRDRIVSLDPTRVIVAAATARRPFHVRERDGDLADIKIFSNWAEFERSKFPPQVSLETGWQRLLHSDFGPPDATIDLGQTETGIRGALPDKGWSDTPPNSTVIANYGVEAGYDGTWPNRSDWNHPLAYLVSNRHGNFTYRIDFSDETAREVALDIMERWHTAAGARKFTLEIGVDDKWFMIGVVDPFAIEPHAPFSIKVYPRRVKSFRIRLSTLKDSKDPLSILNGIRIRRLKE